MFKADKTYKVKTLKQLLDTPGAFLARNASVVKFNTNNVVYALNNSMFSYLGTYITPMMVYNEGMRAEFAGYTFTPEMVLWENKKGKLQHAIKYFT